MLQHGCLRHLGGARCHGCGFEGRLSTFAADDIPHVALGEMFAGIGCRKAGVGVVVGNEIHAHRVFRRIALAAVIHDVVAEVEEDAAVTIGAGSWGSGVVKGIEIVVKADLAIGPDEGPVAVTALAMGAFVETLADDTPLDGDVARALARYGAHFIVGPTGRTMIENHIAAWAVYGKGIGGPLFAFFRQGAADFIARPASQVSNDDIVGTHGNAVIHRADAATRCRLTCDGDVGFGDGEGGLERDGARDVEEDGAGSRGVDGRPKTSRDGAVVVRVVVVEVGDEEDGTATTADRMSTRPFGTGEGGEGRGRGEAGEKEGGGNEQ